jgi:putative ABC transport system permease protein
MLIFGTRRHKETGETRAATHPLPILHAYRLLPFKMSVPLPGDLRYGLRRLNNNAGFTVVAVICLALGICASITVFSVVDTLLIRPLPGVVEQDRIVSLGTKPVRMEGLPAPVTPGISYGDFRRYLEASHVFTGLAAYCQVPLNLRAAGGEPRRVQGQVVSDNYFSTLGLRPAAGRLMVRGDGARGGMTPVVISYDLWEKAFGRRREALGGAVAINSGTFVIVGVTPKAFPGTLHGEPADVWLPLEAAPQVMPRFARESMVESKRGWLYWFFGRLAPGVDAKRAQTELDLLADRFGRGLAQDERAPGLQVYPGLGVWPGSWNDLERPLVLASAVVGLLMLVVCANLGGLLLVKAAARQEEIGVRLALGVTRLRLVRQLLTESLALAVLGGAAGFAMALFAVEWIQDIPLGGFLPRIQNVAIDSRVVAFTLALTLGSGVFFGLIPALWSTRRQVVPLLRPGAGNAGLDRGRTRLQEIFVVAQITVSLILLISTGLFVRTLRNLQSIDPGFDSRHILDVRVDLSSRGYSEPRGAALYDQLLRQVKGLPGVESASLALTVPLSRNNGEGRFSSLRLAGGAPSAEPVSSQSSAVSPSYFRTLGIPLLRGRDFSPQDGAGAPGAVIVDETLAAQLWGKRNPIGQRVVLEQPKRVVLEVVGVARSVRILERQVTQPFFYVPLAQSYEPDLALQVRTAPGDPLRLAASVRDILRKLDPSLAVEVSRYDDEVQETLAQPRLFSWLLGSFSSVALLITALGLYGALSYLVSRRTREMGIRMALGARGSEIVALVIRRGMTLTLTGLVLGLVAASWTTSVFADFLFGVAPTDPEVFVSVAVILTLVGLAASSLPAYSATRVDPMAVIRHE